MKLVTDVNYLYNEVFPSVFNKNKGDCLNFVLSLLLAYALNDSFDNQPCGLITEESSSLITKEIFCHEIFV